MPFTFSHPAIILPLSRLPKNWVSLTGLVIGSMTPDFEYFLRMRSRSLYSHLPSALFWFDLPLGLLCTFLFHYLVRNRLFDNLPRALKTRLSPYKSFNWGAHFKRHWFAVLVSLLIGSASHLFWDSFTHKKGFFVERFPLLKAPLHLGSIQTFPFQILQHLSTLAGAAVIAFALCQMPRNKTQGLHKSSPHYWPIVLYLTAAFTAARFGAGLHILEYGNVIITVIAALLLSLILTPFFLKGKKRRQRTV